MTRRAPRGVWAGVVWGVLAAFAWMGRAAGEPEPPRLLVFPVESHWVLAPLANQMTARLAEEMRGAFTPVIYDPADPRLQEAAGETALTSLTDDRLALLAAADASLRVRLSEAAGQLKAEARLEGAVSGRAVNLEAASQGPSSSPETVAGLARQLVSALTPEVWREVAADAEGKRREAARRYAEGQEAMARQQPEEAAWHFRAAVAGDPDRPEYLVAAAGAEETVFGDVQQALLLMRRARRLAPGDVDLLLSYGELALRAGRPEEAEGAFRAAQAAAPGELRALEGLARAARAAGQFDRAVRYYEELLAALPELAVEPWGVSRLLASQTDDTIRLTAVGAQERPRQLALLLLAAGRDAEGITRLLAYHLDGSRPAYQAREYAIACLGMEREAEAIAREATATLAARDLGTTGDQEAEKVLRDLHARSDRLAMLGERMTPPAGSEGPHRYRVLAWNLLNQSNFEGLLYVQSGEPDRLKRCEFWRRAYREAIAQARELEEQAVAHGEERRP